MLLEPLWEVQLLHQHDRIADPYCPWSVDCSKDANVIVMVLRGGTENAQIAHEIALTVGSHDAAQRWPHPHDPDAPTYFEDPLKPVILEKTLFPRCGFDDNVRAKAARIKLCIVACQRAQVGESATCQHVNAGRVEECARRQRERV